MCCGEVELDANSTHRYAVVGDALVPSERAALEWIEAVSEFDDDP